jgi:hypothetical protein
LRAYKVAGEEEGEEEVEEPEAQMVRHPEGEGPNQKSNSVVEENQHLSGIYIDMVHLVKSIPQLVKKRRLLQEAADDSMDWSSISSQVHDVDSFVNQLLSSYDIMAQEANNSRNRIRSYGGHPVEPPVLLSEHPRSMLK